MRATGIDLSRWDVSFNPPASGGPQFAIQRASYGLSKDILFDAFQLGMKKVPVRGAYCYLLSSFSWQSQADAFLKIVANQGHHFYACDFEGTGNELSIDFASCAVEWMRYIKINSGKPVIIYSNISTYADYLAKDIRTKEFPLWIAWPPTPIPDPQTSTPRLPTARSDWLFWQYSFGEHNSFGAANGVGRVGVDVDVFNGSFEDLCKWAGANVSIPEPPVMTLEETVAKLVSEARAHGWAV